MKKKAHYEKSGKFPHPIEVALYGFKLVRWLKLNGKKVSLVQLQEINDPLEIIEFWKFTNRFSYSESKEAFVPMGRRIKGTSTMKSIWEKVEAGRVRRAWEKAKVHLNSPDGGEPVLEYENN